MTSSFNKAEKVASLLAKETGGYSYKTFKFCYDVVDVPRPEYDDIIDRSKKYAPKVSGETEKIKGSRDITSKLHYLHKFNVGPIFKFFLDGSRRTYKVDDIAYTNVIYPVVAGQIGVGCCYREGRSSFRSEYFNRKIILALPHSAKADRGRVTQDVYLQNLKRKINEGIPFLKKFNLAVDDILLYSDDKTKQGETYENRAISMLHTEMLQEEKNLVMKLVKEKKLGDDSYLLKDGSLQYSDRGIDSKYGLANLKKNYRHVVGVSKSFNPELLLDHNDKSIGRKLADLPVASRTPAFKYTTDAVNGVSFAVWYLRIRKSLTFSNPFEGVVKIEKILISPDEIEYGLESDEVDSISAHVINERNPTCHGRDARWANHLYPIYLTESFIKSKYLSDSYFLNLF